MTDTGSGKRRPGWRLTVAAALLVLGSVVLSGCVPGTPVSGESGATYSEPAWMAQYRQDFEEESQQMVTCMAGKGWQISVAKDWGLVPPKGLSAEQSDALVQSEIACTKEVYGPAQEWTQASWEDKYAKALDTKACLESQGYTISEPPSRDTWVQQALSGGADMWAPFGDLLDQYEAGTIELDGPTYYRLYRLCPQAGPTHSYNEASWDGA